MGADNNRIIMVVDDDEMNLKMAELILKKEIKNIEVILANSGYGCIEKLQQRIMPDVILLDIQMPRMDGIKTLETIRARDEWKNIPVIFLTAAADKNTVIRASKLKVDDYIRKPFMPADLVERVNKVLALKALDDPELADILNQLNNL